LLLKYRGPLRTRIDRVLFAKLNNSSVQQSEQMD
jgi:hypothetical protein